MKLSGFDKLIADCSKDITEHLDKEVNKVGKSALSKVRKLTPVNKDPRIKGGRLRRSWKIQKLGEGKIEIYNNTEYAPHVEYGHRVASRRKQGASKVRYNAKTGEFYNPTKYRTATKEVTKVVPGVFMLRDGLAQVEKELDDTLEAIIEDIWT